MGTNKRLGILCDEITWHTNCKTVKKHLEELQLIEFFDKKNGKTYQFTTKEFHLVAFLIAEIYKQRWQIFAASINSLVMSRIL